MAIKVLAPDLTATPEVRARFEREARAISQLNHPHICTLYDVGYERPMPAAPSPGPQPSSLGPEPTPLGSDEPVHFLVMEYLEGETLAARLDRGPLPLPEVLRHGAEVARALDCAHRRGIVHRDLKPANIMLTTGGAGRQGAPEVKLMDFGLARPVAPAPGAVALAESPTMSRPLTADGTIVGTFQYMAPEQLEGKEADARADLWALGCVLYEMATGRRAFEGTSQASLIAAILKETPRPLAELQPLAPPALDRVVRQCLEKDPGERWQSAHDVASELEWIGSVRRRVDASRRATGTGRPAPGTPGVDCRRGDGRRGADRWRRLAVARQRGNGGGRARPRRDSPRRGGCDRPGAFERGDLPGRPAHRVHRPAGGRLDPLDP